MLLPSLLRTCRARGGALAIWWLGLLVASLPAQALAARILHTEPSAFSPIVVYEERGERCMTFGSLRAAGRQTCQDLANPRRMVFQYTRMVLSGLWLQPRPQRILIIGLGGGTLPTALAELVPDATIETVEIDPAVVRVARTFFGYRPSARQSVHITDGRAYVQAALAQPTRYDLIILDAFDVTYIPRHLMTRGFLEEVKALLSPTGVLVANTFSSSQLYAQESATYAAVFGDFHQLQSSNRVVLARPAGLPSLAELREAAMAWQAALAPYGVETPRLQAMLEGKPAVAPGTAVLED